ncbi:MAG: RdgB/HAM1 family non-canonical purine NTP pyrophosphatase [candidate division WOR-3 bacterium]
MKNFLNDLENLELISLRDLNLKIDFQEVGNTLLENALIKARIVYNILKLPTLSDDSGLFIDALNGFPGVKSADFQKENPDYLEKILKMLQNENNRKAYFKCVLVFIDDKEYIFEGEVEGEISYEIKGDKGFGYDPIFYYKPLNKTFGEIELSIKNQISHRAIALSKFKRFLIQEHLSKIRL